MEMWSNVLKIRDRKNNFFMISRYLTPSAASRGSQPAAVSNSFEIYHFHISRWDSIICDRKHA